MKILLHACCGPCATTAIEELLQTEARVTVFFKNDNFINRPEFDRRLDALHRVCREFSVPLIDGGFDHDSWLASVQGLENEPERGNRCSKCFLHNFGRTQAAVRDLDQDGWTTSLTTSPYKSLSMVKAAGETFADFKLFDFKKKNGYQRSIVYSRKWTLYRQDFCGCEFSLPPVSDNPGLND